MGPFAAASVNAAWAAPIGLGNTPTAGGLDDGPGEPGAGGGLAIQAKYRAPLEKGRGCGGWVVRPRSRGSGTGCGRR